MPQPLWLWAILGLVLLSVELLTGTFYILWFGISALFVALIIAVYPDASFSLQLLAFSALSLTTLAVWRLRYQHARAGTSVGQSRDDTIGKIGTVTSAVSATQQGMIRFTVPVMSSREWAILSEESIAADEAAEVVGIEGNYLRVKRANPQ